MKKTNQPRKDKCKAVMPEPPPPISPTVRNWRRETILKRLFPEGVNEVKIWNAFVPILKREQHDQSGDLLETLADCKLGLKERIKKHCPLVTDQWYVISQGDTDLMCRVTQRAWSFTHSQAKHSHDAVVLHGVTPDEFLLDWAAQAVVTMLLLRIEASV